MASSIMNVVIQTKAMQLVLEPIESQVEQLVIVNDAKYRENARLVSLVPAAQRVGTSTDRLARTAEKMAAESKDETLQEKLIAASDHLAQASHSMMKAARSLTTNYMDRTARTTLVESARGVLEGTLTVLVEWDNSEIRKIVRIAQVATDKLTLVEGIKSMQGLVACFKGFSDHLLQLANAADKRQRELLNPAQREQIVVALANLKKFVPMLSSSMQTFVKNSGNPQAKASRDYVIGQIMLAITEIIRAVEGKGAKDDFEHGYLASTLQKVRAYLAPGANKQTVSSDLDRHMEAIVRNSMAVAHVCAEPVRQEIFQSCHEVTKLRRQLSNDLRAVQTNPGAQSARDAFDGTAELLCEEFRSLNRLVNGAVVQQVATVFVEPSTHIQRLIGAAVAPARPTLDPILELNEPIEAFKIHAVKLSQVATSAATSSQDTRRVRVIQSTAAELDKLTPQIVSAAVATRRNPSDPVAKDHLELLRREWASKVQLLTGTIDDITDKSHFMAASEASIREEMGRCRDATKEANAEKLAIAAQAICGKAKRIADVGRAEISNSDDMNFKSQLQAATTRLETSIPVMSSCSKQAIANIRDPQTQQYFADAMRELLESVKEVREAMEDGEAPPEEQFVVKRKVIAARVDHPSKRDASVQMTATELLHGPKYSSTPSASESRAEPYNPYKQMFASSGRDRDETAIQEKKSLLVGSAQSTAASVLEQIGKSPGQSQQQSGLPIPRDADFGYLGSANTAAMAEATANRLVSAAQSGDQGKVDSQCAAATYLGGNLIGLAEKAASGSSDREKTRLVHVTASEIESLVPQLTEAAYEVSDSPGNRLAVERLTGLAGGWAEKVQVLAGALDSMVTPWSGPAVRLARVVLTGNTSKLDKEAESMKAFSRRMSKLAEAAIAAAEAEDTADVTVGGGMTSSGAPATRDPAAVKRVTLVETLSGEVEKMTPKVISAAQEVAANPGSKTAVERFEMVRREWASKVKALAVAVDDITIGTASPAEALTQAAERSERGAIKDQGDALRQYATALKDVAECASAGCGDPEKVQLVKVASGQVERLTVQLVDAADDMVETTAHDDGSIEKRGMTLDAAEKMELLKREWASKVHLLTAVVDDLTSEVSSPVDRLAGSALAVSRSSGVQKERQSASFREQASSLRDRVARVEERCQAAVKNSVERGKVQKVRNCTDFMAKLTPQVVSAARELAENPDQVTVEHFQLLRRQWASRAQLLVTTLDEIFDADMSAVSAAVQDLLSPNLPSGGTGDGRGGIPSSFASFESLSSASYRPLPRSSSLLRSGRTRSEEKLSSSDWNTQRKRASTGDDVSSLASSLSGSGSKKSSFLSAAARPTPPSARSGRHRRPLSAIEPSTSASASWREMTQSEEELAADASYRSIQEAARSLQEEVNQFEVRGNELIEKANEMAGQMIRMADYTRGKGELQSKAEMIKTSKAIADNGNRMVLFAKRVAERCVDKRMKKDLEYYAEVIPTISQQLRIISSVKAATPKDPSANVMLVKNAQNLMHAVTKTMHAAEAACMKGLRDLGADDAATEVALQWKRKVYKQRTLEAYTAPLGSRGLRKLSRNVAPQLGQAFK